MFLIVLLLNINFKRKNMKRYFILLAVFSLHQVLLSQSEIIPIENTLLDYIEGTSYNYPDQIQKAFYTDANLYLDNNDQGMRVVPISQYIDWFKKGEQGKFNGRVGNILSVDYFGNVAYAKAEVLIPESSLRYIDLFILKKINNQWKIISKTANSETSNLKGDRILFIVSNAHFYGDSNLATGNSYSEIINAYDTFVKAGYTVDFVSPEGGSIPLAYINTSDELSKSYLYNADFMYALKNTKRPSDINPQNYKAVHYIGGGSAMFGVPENTAIQNIVMTIYEDQNGIISSVCHGTAGIVNLKTRSGKYLVEGKRVNGYPDAYERKDAEYFAFFPFLITQTIEERGGDFNYSPRNTYHVEVDGNLVTGQNYLSSKHVALKIIEMLK